MVIKFGRGNLDKSAVKAALKVLDFMDEEGVEYDIVGHLGVSMGEPDGYADQAGPGSSDQPAAVNPNPIDEDFDPMWREFPGCECNNIKSASCLRPEHRGGVSLG